MDCGNINTPRNGSKIGEETTYPQSVEFVCDEGFVLLGSKVRSCQASGTWSGVQLLCKGKRVSIEERKLHCVLSIGEFLRVIKENFIISAAVRDYLV